MAFTPDGIAPPGIPLLGCSPPHHYEVQNGLWGGLIGGTEGVRAPCTLYGATELNKIGWSKAQQTPPFQCSHPIFYSLPSRKPVQDVAHIDRDVVIFGYATNETGCRA